MVLTHLSGFSLCGTPLSVSVCLTVTAECECEIVVSPILCFYFIKFRGEGRNDDEDRETTSECERAVVGASVPQSGENFLE